MPENRPQPPAERTELAGLYVDPRTGDSHPYVAQFRKAAHDVLWSARVRLGGGWVQVRRGRVADAAAEDDDFVVSELVHDSVIDSLSGADMDTALELARQRQQRAAFRAWAVALVLCGAAAAGAWAWWR